MDNTITAKPKQDTKMKSNAEHTLNKAYEVRERVSFVVCQIAGPIPISEEADPTRCDSIVSALAEIDECLQGILDDINRL